MDDNLFLHKASQLEPAEMPVCLLIVELGTGFGGYRCCSPDGATHSSVLAWRTPGMVEPGACANFNALC